MANTVLQILISLAIMVRAQRLSRIECDSCHAVGHKYRDYLFLPGFVYYMASKVPVSWYHSRSYMQAQISGLGRGRGRGGQNHHNAPVSHGFGTRRPGTGQRCPTTRAHVVMYLTVDLLQLRCLAKSTPCRQNEYDSGWCVGLHLAPREHKLIVTELNVKITNFLTG
jgi:hypothetical protein